MLYVILKVDAIRRARRQSADWQQEAVRLLLAVLAAGLMARMALNGRIFQYGFYQAALAGVLIPAVLLGELRGWLRLQQGNLLIVAGLLALLTPGVVWLTQHANGLFRLKTEPVGKGGDMFYALRQEADPSGRLVTLAVQYLEQHPAGKNVVVMPEGTTINYLARRPSPVAAFSFFGATTTEGRAEKLIAQLRRTPPDWVLLVSFDLREYGILRYGEKPGYGLEMLQWLQEDYQRVNKVGGDPLMFTDGGAQIFSPKPKTPGVPAR